MKNIKQKTLSPKTSEIKDIVRLVTSVFIRECKHYGLYYYIMNSDLKKSLGSESIRKLFAEINVCSQKQIFEHSSEIQEIEFITHILNNLIRYFLDGKSFIKQNKLSVLGLHCFNLICKTRFGNEFQEEQQIETQPKSWFDLFCIETYKQNKCFHEIDFTTFLRSNLNLLKASYKKSDFYRFEQNQLSFIMGDDDNEQEDEDCYYIDSENRCHIESKDDENEDDYYYTESDFPF